MKLLKPPGFVSLLVWTAYHFVRQQFMAELLLKDFGEKELINHLALYTNEIISAAKDYDPTKVTRYVTQLATLFHKFYNACRVKGEEEGLMQARLALCDCVRAVIKNVLTMFNINGPESM